MFDKVDTLKQRDIWYQNSILIDPSDYANHVSYKNRVIIGKINSKGNSLLDAFVVASARIQFLRKDENQHAILSYTRDNSILSMRQGKRYDVCLFSTLVQL